MGKDERIAELKAEVVRLTNLLCCVCACKAFDPQPCYCWKDE